MHKAHGRDNLCFVIVVNSATKQILVELSANGSFSIKQIHIENNCLFLLLLENTVLLMMAILEFFQLLKEIQDNPCQTTLCTYKNNLSFFFSIFLALRSTHAY